MGNLNIHLMTMTGASEALVIAKIMDEIDSNKDGVIDFDEFCNMM